jgi:hypothetical protein
MPGYWYSTEVDGDRREDGGAHRGKVRRRRRTGAGHGGGPAGSSGALRLAPGRLLGRERTQLRGRTTSATELDDGVMHASCRKKRRGWLGLACLREEERDREREGRRRSLSAWRWGAGHGGASVELEEERDGSSEARSGSY